MAAARIIVGDIVRLKSGGPYMTVTKDRIEASTKAVQASWFSGSDLKTEVFFKDALESKEGAPVPVAAE